ncbi:MAG: chemotaxis protein CheW [Polyangiaceae bacterium]|nr:chemotaxis protein CheW [Polyangiaceae bacterium]
MSQHFVMVKIQDRKRIMRLSDIREVVSLMALSPIEGARGGTCRGVANIRGEMIPIFDLAGADARLSPSRVVVIARLGVEHVGLLVDDVTDVIDLSDEHVAVRNIGGGRTSTIVRMDDEVMTVMEPVDVLGST